MVQLNKLIEAVDIIENATKILVLAHERPDGDALGSALGLVEILRQRGQNADAFMPDAFPAKFEAITGNNHLKTMTIDEINGNYDLVITLDSATSSRIALGGEINFEMFTVPTLNIDHHASSDVVSTWSYVDGNAAATSLLVYTLAKEANWQINIQAATLLLIGIITDTGAFRFENSSADALHVAAELRELGGKWGEIMNTVFFSKPLNQQHFEAELIHCHATMACQGRYYFATVTDELLAKYNFSMRDGEAVIDLLREISGVVIAALIYPREGAFKCSLRSKDRDYPVSEIASKFNGGGHLMAAGCTIHAPSLDAAKELLLEVVTETLDR